MEGMEDILHFLEKHEISVLDSIVKFTFNSLWPLRASSLINNFTQEK